MWKRNTKDPLGCILFERFGLHILARPRQNLSVSNVFPVSNGRSATPGSLNELIGAKLKLPEISKGELLSDLIGITSEEISGSIGFNFLEGFLAAVGAQSFIRKLSALFGTSKAKAVQFNFTGATRDSVDPFAFERVLRKHKCKDLLIKEGYSYYVAVAVHRSDKIMFSIFDSQSATIDVGADVAAIGSANVKAVEGMGNKIMVTSNVPLAYGVELSGLEYNDTKNRLELSMIKNYVHVMGSPMTNLPGSARSMIGGQEDTMLLEIMD